jgi:hypothetical protein
MAGGLLTGLAGVLSIQTASISVGPISVTQPYSGAFSAPAFVVAAAVIVVLGVAMLLAILPPPLARVGPIIAGCAVVLMAVVDLQGIGQFLGLSSPGLGWFSAVGGGIVCAIGGMVARENPMTDDAADLASRRRRTEAQVAPSPVSQPEPPRAAPGPRQPATVQGPDAAQTAAAPHGLEIPALLRELAALRDAGVLTEEEFEKKKSALLERL